MKRPDVILTPILVVTQSDANALASKIPHEYVRGKKNYFVTIGVLDKEGIENHTGKVVFSHFVSNEDGTDPEVKGEWAVSVPIVQLGNKHVFKVGDFKL